jgi:DNA-binding beta-propeller fold protein YncE
MVPIVWAAWARRCCRKAWSGCGPTTCSTCYATVVRPRRCKASPKNSETPRSSRWQPGCSAPAATPRWEQADIEASRIVYHAPGTLPDRPVFSADPSNLFLVVEAGTHHVSVLDGDKLEPIHRFTTRFALHGGPKFSSDGRYVYMASRDGWVSKYDLWNLKLVAEIRAGMNTRNLAVSEDGEWVMVGNTLPQTLVLLRVGPVAAAYLSGYGRGWQVLARFSRLRRRAAWFVHRRAARYSRGLGDPIHRQEDVRTARDRTHGRARRLLLRSAVSPHSWRPRTATGQVIDLDVGRKVADLALTGMPHLGSGITWKRNGREVMASPNLKQGAISVIDMQSWKTVATIPTNGPGFFLRSHEATPYAWTDAMMSPKRDTLQVIDKQTLAVVGSVTPSPGRTAAHVEFTRDGRYALVSLMEADGAIVVYDARTLKEIKRLPMDKPIGKYNVFNKTTRSSGTSH